MSKRKNQAAEEKRLSERVTDAAHAASDPSYLLDRDRAILYERGSRQSAELKLSAAIKKIEHLESRIDTLTSLECTAPHVITSRKSGRGDKNRAIAGINWSDWHVEEAVRPEAVSDLNRFDLEIADKRIKNTYERGVLLLEDARRLAHIDHVVVSLLGDFISGWIHPDLVESNCMSPLEATRWVAPRIEAGLRYTLDHGNVKQMTVVTAVGNHGRATDKMRIQMAERTSYEYDMYWHLARRFDGDKRVRFQLGEGYHNTLDFFSYPVRFSHGWAIKYQDGIGGIAIGTNKKVKAWNEGKRAYFDVFGHHHQFLWEWNWMCNGSLIGYGSLGVACGGRFQPPLQSFFVIDEQRGMTRALPIFCE